MQLADNKIMITLHRVKNAHWSFLNLVGIMRCILLTKQAADLFSYDFLNTAKSSGYRVNIPAKFIALRNLIAAPNV